MKFTFRLLFSFLQPFIQFYEASGFSFLWDINFINLYFEINLYLFISIFSFVLQVVPLTLWSTYKEDHFCC